ncbi:MAG: U32 family peptidase, partial [Methanolinea sp.]|nr:U32 family peptidase [Methanolinea sp.]
MTGSIPGRPGAGVPELLAPAGSMDAFRAAVAAGADAVYLGGHRFGARQFADNFTLDEIREAVTYAHRQGVKVYVTVNTLVHDRELTDVSGYLLGLYTLGVDAILLQDIGLASLAHSLFPDLSLHASTQCTISSLEGILWAGNFGFSRVVLAREIGHSGLERILSIPRQKRPGLEVFVHGALCYSYSGQCLLSSFIGGRSG